MKVRVPLYMYKAFGLTVNTTKTKFMPVIVGVTEAEKQRLGGSVECVNEFRYLGCWTARRIAMYCQCIWSIFQPEESSLQQQGCHHHHWTHRIWHDSSGCVAIWVGILPPPDNVSCRDWSPFTINASGPS